MKKSVFHLSLFFLVFIYSCGSDKSTNYDGYWYSKKTDWESSNLKGKVKSISTEIFSLNIEDEDQGLVKGVTIYREFNQNGCVFIDNFDTNSTYLNSTLTSKNKYKDTIGRFLTESYYSYVSKSKYSDTFELEFKTVYSYDNKGDLSRTIRSNLKDNTQIISVAKYEKGKVTIYDYENDISSGYTVNIMNSDNKMTESKTYSKDGVVEYESFHEYRNEKIKDSVIDYEKEDKVIKVLIEDSFKRVVDFKTYTYENDILKNFENVLNEYDNNDIHSSYVERKYKDENHELLTEENRVEKILDSYGNIISEITKDLILNKVVEKKLSIITYFNE